MKKQSLTAGFMVLLVSGLAACGGNTSGGGSSTGGNSGTGSGGSKGGTGGSGTMSPGTGGASAGGSGGTAPIPPATGGTGGSTATGGSTGATGGSTAGTGGSAGSNGGSTATDGGPSGGGGAGGVAAGGAGGSDAGMPMTMGGNSISGTVAGKPFDKVVTALWIPGTDDKTNAVIYVWDIPVKCADIGAGGWDAKVGVGHPGQHLEMKLGSVAAGTFKVSTNMLSIAKDEAQINHSTDPVVSENKATAGSVVVTSIATGKNAVGTFDISVGADPLKGAFDATYCATGMEP